MGLPSFSAYGPARLLARTPVASEQLVLELGEREGALEAYTLAGQFCRVRVALADGTSAEGIFAIASAPGEGALRFLVRTPNPEGGEAADRLAEIPVGSAIEMTLPAGDGFALERARGRDVDVVATGTAIAPARAAIYAMLGERARYGRITLDHGLRSEAHVAIESDVARWRELGIEVHLHYSHVDDAGQLIGALAHHALLAREKNVASAAIVAVGQSRMVAELRDAMAKLGGDASLVLHNY